MSTNVEVVVLGHRGDRCAGWLCDRLHAEGVATRLVVAEVLVHSLRWEHRISELGASVVIDLPGGGMLASGATVALVNRLDHVPFDASRTTSTDRTYAIEEVHAFFVSWLACFSTVANRPRPDGLSGRVRHAIEWAALARRAGMPIAPVTDASGDGAIPLVSRHMGDQIFVIGDEVLGADDAKLESAARALAHLAEVSILGLVMESDERGVRKFVGATTVPDLREAGTPGVVALRRLLLGTTP